MKSIYKYIFIVFASVCTLGTQAQQNSTMYFMQGIAERNALNPAFQPFHNFYLQIAPISSTQFGVGNNAVSFSDVVFNKKINGQDSTITFLHPKADTDKFYKNLPNTTRFNMDLNQTILKFGFRVAEKNYFSFGISQRFQANFYIPKDFFQFIIYGVDTTGTSSFNFNKMGIRATAFTEAALGYSRKIDEKLTVGGNLKLLFGQANISTKNDGLRLNAGSEQWAFEGNSTINASVPSLVVPFKENGSIDLENLDYDDFQASSLFGKNIGLAVDLGATYQILPNLQVSASLTDFGFIRWSKNTVNAGFNGQFEFNGIDFDMNDNGDAISEKTDSILTKLQDAFSDDASRNAYTTMLQTTMNIGAEYSILNDKISFGLLSSTMFTNKTAFEELTASANFRPFKCFNASLSYTLLGGSYTSLGLGLQLKTGPINWYVLADQIPMMYAGGFIPRDLKSFNFMGGMAIVIGNPDKKKAKAEQNRTIEYQDISYLY